MWIRFQSPAKASLMTSLIKDYTHARGKMLVCKLVDSSTQLRARVWILCQTLRWRL